jgi:hypothetical protein
VHDGNEDYFANKIYGDILVDKTRETLDESGMQISKLADVYYQKVAESASKDLSVEILDAIVLPRYLSTTTYLSFCHSLIGMVV